MNSDEDTSYPFLCKGSGVLGIFSSSGVLPAMSTCEVSDLEDVFAKTTVSSPESNISSQSMKKLEINKPSANVISQFENNSDVTLTSGAPTKVLEVKDFSNMNRSIQLHEETEENLINASSALKPENSDFASLDVPFKTASSLQKGSVNSEAGTVELAEEIMEAFADSKAVLDPENAVPTDPASLQEELDRLEQLAVERVREIEGELVDISKQISAGNVAVGSCIDNDASSSDDKLEGTNLSPTVSGEIISDASDSIRNESRKEVDDSNENNDALQDHSEVSVEIQENENVSLLKAVSVEEETETKQYNDMQEEISICIEERDTSSAKESDTFLHSQEHKANDFHFNKQEELNTDVSISNRTVIKENIISKDITKEGDNKLPNESGVKEHENDEMCLVPGERPLTQDIKIGKTTNEFDNYETEEDDLKDLEAFIVKTATNPELAVCASETENNDPSKKYSLESSLLDDLTKTDECLNNCEVKNNTSLQVEYATEETHFAQTKQKTLQNEDSIHEHSESVLKVGELCTDHKISRSKDSVTNGKKLPLKKRLSQRSANISDEEELLSSSVTKGNNGVKDKEVMSDRKRSRGRSVTLENTSEERVETSANKRKKDNSVRNYKEKSWDKLSNSHCLPSKEKKHRSKVLKKVEEDKDFCITTSVTDVSERKSNEETIDKSKRKQRQLVQINKEEICHPEEIEEGKLENESSYDQGIVLKREKKSKPKTGDSNCEKLRRYIYSSPERKKNKSNIKVSKINVSSSFSKSVRKSSRQSAKRTNSLPEVENLVLKRGHNKTLTDDESDCNISSALNNGGNKAYTYSNSKRKRISSAEEKPILNSNSENSILIHKIPISITTEKTSKNKMQITSTPLNHKRTEDSGKFCNLSRRNSKCGLQVSFKDFDDFRDMEDLTFDLLKKYARDLILPSPLWGAQVSCEKSVVIFSRVCVDISDEKPLTDKALVFQGSLKPTALIMNEPVDLPIPLIRTFDDVYHLIRNFHNLSFCEGTGITQRPQSKFCFGYLDVANSGRRCSLCQEERRRLLFTCARKLRDRLAFIKEQKCKTK